MTITLTLSRTSIKRAANQLRRYAKSIEKKTERLVDDLGSAGVEYANNYLEHDDTGFTRSTITYNRQGKSAVVSVGGAAVWIEFGTGVLANAGQTPHPKRDEVGAVPWGEYQYGLGKGEWWFYSRKYGWCKTKGIKKNPFMYNASQDMRMNLTEIARRAWND